MKKIFLLTMVFMAIFSSIHAQEVSISGNKFMVGSKQIWFNGINTPWQNWADFGGNFTPDWWRSEFQDYVDNKINLARIWIHCNGSNSPTTNDDGTVTGASTLFWTHMDSLIAISKAKQLYILPCLWSFDMVKNTNTETYQKYRNLINSQSNIQTYIDNFLIPLIQRYDDEPYVLGWEICNEPEWMFYNSENGPIDLENVQLLHAMCAAAIHKNCTKPVTTGSACVKWNSYMYLGIGDNAGNVWGDTTLQRVYNDADAYMDFWQIHWYSWMTQWFYSPYQKTPAYYSIDDKPVLVGETPGLDVCDSYICQTLTEMYENAYLNDYDGVCGWKTPQNDGYGTFANISVATNAFYSNHPTLVYPGMTVVAVTGVTVSPATASVDAGSTVQLTATVSPSNATTQTVTWSSGNTSVATVSSAGVVTGISEGTVTITATTTDGGYSASCTVTVSGSLPECSFGAPLSTALLSVNGSYTYVYVLGVNGPSLSNVTTCTINWDLSMNGLWQFSFNTNNGVPQWWIDLRTVATWSFDQAQPYITFAGSGFTGLDGSYWVALDGSNLVLVSQTGAYTIYFSTSGAEPTCSKSAKEILPGNESAGQTMVYPNPFGNNATLQLGNAQAVKSVRIVDLTGKVVEQLDLTKLNGNLIEFGDNLPAGLYFIQVNDSDGTQSYKIVKK